LIGINDRLRISGATAENRMSLGKLPLHGIHNVQKRFAVCDKKLNRIRHSCHLCGRAEKIRDQLGAPIPDIEVPVRISKTLRYPAPNNSESDNAHSFPAVFLHRTRGKQNAKYATGEITR
jgi:hypothetical protein